MKLFILATSETSARAAASNWLRLGIQHPWPDKAVVHRSLGDARFAWRDHRELPELYLILPDTRIAYPIEVVKIEDRPKDAPLVLAR